MGYVQNLFYPPLNDLILGGLIKLIPINADEVYKIYLSIIWVLINLSVHSLTKYIPQKWLKLLFQFSFLLLFINGNSSNLEDQGLSFQDMLVFGLTPQLLSMIFFIEWLKIFIENYKNKNWKSHRFIALTTAVLLSHLVTSLVLVTCFVFYIWEINKEFRLQALKDFSMSFLVSLFFWGPFLFYKSALTTSLITNEPRIGNLIAVLISLAILYRYRLFKKAFFYFSPVVVFIAPAFLKYILDFISIDWLFPDFHYYRFTQYSNWVFVIVFFLFASKLLLKTSLVKIKYVAILSILAIFFTQKTLVFGYFYELGNQVIYDTEKINKLVGEINSEGRIWTKHLERTIDTTIPQISIRENPNAKFTKGLFWETSHNNQYLANYLLTLGGMPTVLAGISYDQIDLNEYACFQKMFIEDFGITHLIAPEPLYLTNSRSQMPKWRDENIKKSRLAYEIIDSRYIPTGPPVKYNKVKTVDFGFNEFSLYQIEHFDQNAVSMVETIRPDIRILPYKKDLTERLHLFKKMTISRCTSTLKNRDSLITNLDRSKIPFVQYPYKPGKLNKLGQGHYELTSGHNEPTLNLIKLSYLPFWELKQDNQAIELTNSWPGMLAIWQGKAILKYRRSSFIKTCYFISFFTLLFLFFQTVIRSKRNEQ